MVQGLDRLNARFNAIPKRVRDAAEKELERSAAEIVATMKRFASRGRTGKMADSIGWTWGDAPAGTMKVGSVGGKVYGSMSITIYAGGKEAFYATYQEFGTKEMRAHPFFFPAWRAHKKKVNARLKRAMTKAIKS
jgi:HK97 gp10 family phage protein